MRFYCVTSTFDDKGRATASITDTVEIDTKPENTAKSVSRKDIYKDWFDSEEKAKEFIKEALA